MRHTIKFGLLILASTVAFTSCKKEIKDSSAATQGEISSQVIAQIAALGFSTNNVQKIEEGYLVEEDIILTPEQLNERPTSPTLRIAEVEQYRTFNLVTGMPRTLVVTTSGGNITQRLSDGINAAIARYNAETLGLTFVRGGSNGGGNINIRVVRTNQYIASAGFPSGGNPYYDIKYSRTYTNYSLGFVTTVIAHEAGHCIGMRHTDWMQRSYSCGSGGSEGSGSVGAVQIPGTPSGPDAGSWMLACLSATTDRPFNANDKIALDYLYP